MSIGIIGLGIMGSAYAKHLLAAGEVVLGVDPSEDARERLDSMGGKAIPEIGERLSECELVILSLADPDVLHSVCRDLAGVMSAGRIVVETGTFALADKETARDILAQTGITLLDCTVSGTGAQAWEGDLVMMVSGPQEATEAARPTLTKFTRKIIDAGPFGGGTKLKFVANHAVAIHNVAAAETLNYARRMGLEPGLVYELLSTGAGQSRMSDLRMPLMIEGDYDPPTASLKIFAKDLSVIGDDISRLEVQAPLFDVCADLYGEANERLPETFDTASIYEVYARDKFSSDDG